MTAYPSEEYIIEEIYFTVVCAVMLLIFLAIMWVCPKIILVIVYRRLSSVMQFLNCDCAIVRSFILKESP